MKRYIRSDEEIYDSEPGFLFEFGNHAIFYKHSGSNLTDNIVRAIINKVCDYRNVSDTIRETALQDRPTLDDFRRRISKATLTKVDTGKVIYYSIKGKYFTMNFPEEDFAREVIVF